MNFLQSSVSHDPSEIIPICWFITSVETVVLRHIVFWNMWYFFIWWIQREKQQHLFKIEIFSNNIYYDSFNTSLLNKNYYLIILKKRMKQLLTPNFLIVFYIVTQDFFF